MQQYEGKHHTFYCDGSSVYIYGAFFNKDEGAIELSAEDLVNFVKENFDIKYEET